MVDGGMTECELNRRLSEMKGLGGVVMKNVIRDRMELDVMSTLKCVQG